MKQSKESESSKRARDLEAARRVLSIEARAIDAVSARLDQSFGKALEILAGCESKVVVSGMGKSGLVCRKIAATFASTGTPSIFLHAAEAAHGDSGVFAKGDVVLALSGSGETEEILRLLPIVKRFGLPLLAMTGGAASTLAQGADVVIDVGVEEEACPMGLAPTASTTVALAVGDALAVALLERKGFGPEDFAVLHPAGSLGRRFLRVRDLMHVGDALPLVGRDAPFRETILEMTRKRLGVTGVIDEQEHLIGVVTDGDLRRALEEPEGMAALTAARVMTADPKTISMEALAEEAVSLMERFSITSLFITDAESTRPRGIIHLHDLLKARVV